MTLGPVMLDVIGTSLTSEDRTRLMHPATGGVILFSRNFSDPQQLYRLCQEIHELKRTKLLISVDQEGGRVQRFREGFTRLPALKSYGVLYDHHQSQSLKTTRQAAWLMATELRAYGIDFSFAPVLDIGNPVSKVIGDRAFHNNPDVIINLANAWMQGCHEAGMAVVGKHFPGHGNVEADSHHEIPLDNRSINDIEMEDLRPFASMIESGMDAIMPAHVIYPRIDNHSAGFSTFWIQNVLREQLKFQGVVFSDDLSMAAAETGGDYAARAQAALTAGCDMVLVCNNPSAADEVLESLKNYSNPVSQLRLVRMHGRHEYDIDQLKETDQWKLAISAIESLSQIEFPMA